MCNEEILKCKEGDIIFRDLLEKTQTMNKNNSTKNSKVLYINIF